MDQRLKTAAIKLLGAAAVTLGTGGVALAQDTETRAQSAETNAQDAQPKVGTSIFGSTALPKGLTIVPWKGTGAGKITSGPIQQVEVPLEPVDPAEFRRRLEYHQQSGASE